jgi:hypothetical protein
MSKEQTAEEFYNEHYKGASSCTVCFWTHEMVEQYAQAKVLEALERYENKILQVVEKKADVKDYILRNRSKTKVY